MIGAQYVGDTLDDLSNPLTAIYIKPSAIPTVTYGQHNSMEIFTVLDNSRFGLYNCGVDRGQNRLNKQKIV